MATLPAISTPQLPREYFIPTGVPSTAGTIRTVGPAGTVGSSYIHEGVNTTTGLGTALQAAINACSAGDRVVVTTKHPDTNAPLVYDTSAGFALKVFSNTTTWSVLTTDTAESGALVPFGYRVDPSDTLLMPTLNVSGSNQPCLYTDWNDPTNTIGGHYWHICGFHFTNSIDVTGPMIGIGTRGGRYAWLAAIAAHHIVIDRCWVQGSPKTPNWCSRGILIAGHHIAVVNNYIHGFAEPNADAQGIAVAKGIGRANYAGDILGSPSPVHIENNFIEAEHESMNFGGDLINFDDVTENEVCDVTLRGNFITKDLRRHPCTFTGVTYDSTLGSRIKNLMEFKHGNRVLVEGNHFRHSWRSSDNQNYAICLTTSPHRSNTYHADQNCDDVFGPGSPDYDSGSGYCSLHPYQGFAEYPSVRDITMQYNIFEGVRSWLQTVGSQFGDATRVNPTVGVACRWLFQHNLVVDMRLDPWSKLAWNGTSYACGVVSTDPSASITSNHGNLVLWNCSNPATTTWKGGPDYVTFDHNTLYMTAALPDATVPNQGYWGYIWHPGDDNLKQYAPVGMRFTNNIVECGNRGFWSGVSSQGQAAIENDFGSSGGYAVQGNVFVNYGGVGNDPPNGIRAGTMSIASGNKQVNGNYYVKTWAQVGFVKRPADGDLMYEAGFLALDPANANSAATADTDLNVNTNILNKATDGSNPGCDMRMLQKYAGGVGRYTVALGLVERGTMQSVRTIKNRRFGV